MYYMFVEFSMYSETLSLEQLMEVLPLKPTYSWRKGEPKGKRSLATRPNSAWRFSTPESDKGLSEHMANLFSILEPYTEKLIEFKAGNDVQYEIGCVPHMESDTPEMHLDANIIAWMSRLGAEFDVDLYLFVDDDKINN